MGGWEHAVAHLIEALRYKPESRGSIPDYVISTVTLHNEQVHYLLHPAPYRLGCFNQED